MKRIEGVNVAAITPHGANGRDADVGAVLELIDFLGQSGVHGIALLGTTGEFLSLDLDERARLIYLAAKRSPVPVLAGVAHATLDGALELGREAAAAGAAGLLLMPPYFFRYGQNDIREFYLQFARQIGPSAPIYLYNIPAFTSKIACSTAVDLLDTGLFAGIKDSSGSFEDFLCLREVEARQPVTVLVGNDGIFTRARRVGAHGVVSGVACALPELMLALDRAIVCGDTEKTDRLEARLEEFVGWIDQFPTPVGIKTAVALRGVKTGPLAVPLALENQRRLDEFQEWFEGWLPELKKETADG